jgi:hypothetical protein
MKSHQEHREPALENQRDNYPDIKEQKNEKNNDPEYATDGVQCLGRYRLNVGDGSKELSGIT